jgi:hypothetical protein
MRLIRSKKFRLALVVASVAALAIAAAAALGNVTIYLNNFSKKADYAQIRTAGGGKACGRSYREGAEKLRVIVKKGGNLCEFSPPITGDSDLPDHDVRVQGKFLKDRTPRSQRKGAYIALAVRVAPGERYQFIVKPRTKKWALTRSPNGSGFPKRGREKSIRPLDKNNTLRLRAFGTRIRAYVNGEKVAALRENNPGQVSGRHILFGLGNTHPGKKQIEGLMDNLRVQVPVP